VTRSPPPILTRPFLLVSFASLAYFVSDGTSFALVSRFAIGELQADAFGAGLTYGAFSLSALVLRPLSGRLADRSGRRETTSTSTHEWPDLEFDGRWGCTP